MKYITGFLMAIADSVPGVSGGTIAFILRQYDNFIGAISGLTNKDTYKQSINYLLRWGAGWIIGFVLTIFSISSLMVQYPYEVCSVFLGFIAISIPLIAVREKENLTKFYNIIFLILGAGLVYFISSSSSGLLSFNSDAMNFQSYIYLFISGFIAITAMLLPGISGSTVLMIFGVYFYVIESIKQILTLNFSPFFSLVAVGLGILSSAVLSTKAIKYSLENYRGQMVYLIMGLMIGSIYSIIVGPTTMETATPMAAMSLSTFNIGFFLIGVALIGLLELVSAKLKR